MLKESLLMMIALLYAISVLSCEGPNDPLPDPSRIMPLSVGNYWIYKKTSYMGIDEVRYVIDGTHRIEGKLFYSYTRYNVDQPLDPSFLIYNDDEGLKIAGYMWDDTGYEECNGLIVPYPALEGDIWDRECIMIGSLSPATYQVVAIDTNIVTQSGTFKCYAIESQFEMQIYKEYYCPNVGLIKYWQSLEGEIFQLELIEKNIR